MNPLPNRPGAFKTVLVSSFGSHPLSRATSSRILPPSFAAPLPLLARSALLTLYRLLDCVGPARCTLTTAVPLLLRHSLQPKPPFSLSTPFHSRNRLSYSLGLWYISRDIPTSSAYTHVANAHPNPPQTPIPILLYLRRAGSHAVHRLTLLYMLRMSASL
jgi:hypothetical protein